MTQSAAAGAVPARPAGMARVAVASVVGTTIEWYDFFLYGSAAALIFNKLFFPKFDPLVGTLLAFLTFGAGFLARPVGGILFGHLGDLAGRKRMLVISLMLMGGATVAVGLLPTYAAIGVLAPILLVVCRLVQGLAVGGEWGGAVLLVAENADARHRGFWTSWPQAGVALGQAVSGSILVLVTATVAPAAFQAWGWRIPFLLSAVLVAVGLWVRFSLSDTPVFEEARRRAESEPRRRAPVLEAVRHYPREILNVVGVQVCNAGAGYVFTTFLLVYVVQHAKLPQSVGLAAVIIASVWHAFAIPLSGALSDRVGRRPMFLAGAAGVGIFAFLFFPLVDLRSPVVVVLAVAVGLTCHGAMFGPVAAFFAESFGTSVRYSGAGTSYQVTTMLVSALTPTIAVALLAQFHGPVAVSLFVALLSAITFVSALLARETVRRDLRFDRGHAGSQEPAAPAGAAAVPPQVE